VAGAETLGTVSSPSNVLCVSVTVNDEGRPGYSITRGGREIVTESRLGFLLTDAPKLERNFRGDGVQTRSFDETWEQPWGERRYVRDRYNELRVKLVEKNAPGRALTVVFRAFDDGVGFRSFTTSTSARS
jgi:alpha-glucosidase